MMRLKKIVIVILIFLITLITRRQSLIDDITLTEYIVSIFNSFSIDKLIDVFSILIYSVSITLWVTAVAFSINSYYENYIFLVTRLGGQGIFNKKLFIKAFKEITILITSTYVLIITYLMAMGHFIVGDIVLIIISLLLNYTVVIMLTIIFMIFRIYYSFSLAFTFTYLIEISLLVIGLFLKYIQSRIFLIKNPVMQTIMFFYSETIKINTAYYVQVLILNFVLIIILIGIYNYLLWRRREIND